MGKITDKKVERKFKLTVIGKGGHGAMPQQTRDPLIATSVIITEIRSNLKNKDSLSFTSFKSGTKFNIIPEVAIVLGVIKANNMDEFNKIKRKMEIIIKNTANSFRVRTIFE